MTLSVWENKRQTLHEARSNHWRWVFLVSSTSSTILVSRNHKRGAGKAALLPELWGAHLLSRAPCPLIALSQEGQLATISPERHWTHSLWTIWQWRHTSAICLIIPLVNNGCDWDGTLEKKLKWLPLTCQNETFQEQKLRDREMVHRDHQSFCSSWKIISQWPRAPKTSTCLQGRR